MNVKLSDSVNLNHALLRCDCLFCHTLFLFSSFLLVSNCFLSSLAGTSIVLRALSSYRQTVTVTYPSVTSDIHEPLYVRLNLASQVSLDLIVIADVLTNLCSLC